MKNQKFKPIRRIFSIILFILIILGLLLVYLPGNGQANPFAKNLFSLKVLRAMTTSPDLIIEVKQELSDQSAIDCHANWLLGIVLDRMGDQPGKRTSFQRLLGCSGTDVDSLIAANNQDEIFTRQIIQKYPTNPRALYSLATIIMKKNPEEAISLLNQVVLYNPSNGLAWCNLGTLYRNQEQLDNSLASFINCCFKGDPGTNGCWYSGQIYEKAGNIKKAIEYYGLSRSQMVQDRANELEKQLQP